MTERKDQKIVVLIENAPSDHNLILHGIKLAGIFKKGLCLAGSVLKGSNQGKEQVWQTLESYRNVVSGLIPSLPVSSIILSGKAEIFMEELADTNEAVLIVTRRAAYPKLSKILRASPIPFLFVDEKQAAIPEYKKIILPIDLRKESKDAILWSSYFARFNSSLVDVLAATDKVKENARSVTKNLLSVKNLFAKFNLGVKFFKGKKSSLKIQFEALEHAAQSDADLLIILGSSYISFFDVIIGLPEKKILKKAGDLPVLVINPRKDMYILCD